MKFIETRKIIDREPVIRMSNIEAIHKELNDMGEYDVSIEINNRHIWRYILDYRNMLKKLPEGVNLNNCYLVYDSAVAKILWDECHIGPDELITDSKNRWRVVYCYVTDSMFLSRKVDAYAEVRNSGPITFNEPMIIKGNMPPADADVKQWMHDYLEKHPVEYKNYEK